MSDLTITDVDVDGAVQEAHEALGGDTRGDFFKKAALGGGAILGSGALLGGLPALASGATKKSAKNDVKILNYALTLEYLEAAFYKEAVSGGVVNGPALDGAKIVAKHEADHVKALKQALGSAAVKKPTSTSRAPRRTRRSSSRPRLRSRTPASPRTSARRGTSSTRRSSSPRRRSSRSRPATRRSSTT
jgi:hypothetical protein